MGYQAMRARGRRQTGEQAGKSKIQAATAATRRPGHAGKRGLTAPSGGYRMPGGRDCRGPLDQWSATHPYTGLARTVIGFCH